MKNDQIFTPVDIVKKMLDNIDYVGENIEKMTIFEPSFGNGAFLIEIAKRALDHCEKKNYDAEKTKKVLENIHGIEIDNKYYEDTIKRLNSIVAGHNILFEWKNLIRGDLLDYHPSVLFDVCIGNPPYVRIQDLNETEREKITSKCRFGTGNTDLYVAFYELCIGMLSPNGVLTFISPNSYMKNSSQKWFRKYLTKNNLLDSITDYGNVKVFDNIMTYAAITTIKKNRKSKNVTYSLMKSKNEQEYTTTVSAEALGMPPWVFVNPKKKAQLDEITTRSTKLKDLCSVQYGIATNADKVYIVKPEDFEHFESKILRPITKASTLDSTNKIIFPYRWNPEKKRYEVIQEEELKTEFPKTYAYLQSKRNILEKRDMEKNTLWYQYARSQGIQNTNQKKIAIKHVLFKENDCCEFKELTDIDLVYSGIYITIKDESKYQTVIDALKDREFYKYLLMNGKDMAGNYKSVNAKVIKNYGIK